MRKPLTGALSMGIQAVKDVDHAATGRLSRGPETFVIMKVEDSFKVRTKSTRTDRWTDESHTVEIEKANEIELTVYDKSGAHPTPIGMLWIRISDIAEEMRRKKIEADLNNSQWVTADKMNNGGQVGQTDSAYSQSTNLAQDRASRGLTNRDPAFNPPGQSSQHAAVIDAWFALEPVGRIHLTLSFCELSFCIVCMILADRMQQNKLKTEDRLTLDSIAKARSVNARRRSMSCMVTNSYLSSFITSCVAHSVGNSSNTLLACNVQTASTHVTENAILKLLQSV